MLKIVVQRNGQHPATGDTESTFDTLYISNKEIEDFILKKWMGINDSKVVECVVEEKS